MKYICITDLHFGNKNNSQQHNNDLLKFFEYLVDYGSKYDITNIIITGDIFQQRDKLDILTACSSMNAFSYLSDHFTIKSIKGNHDLYYRDTRDTSSLDILSPFMDIVDFYEIEDDRMFVSWICNQEEYDEIINVSKEQNISYMFGHYEFSNFAMNDNYVMEHGQSHKELKHVSKIFTGHYHKRQEKDNVIYIGTPFPYDMNDANDSNRGFLVFDSETGDHYFENYEKIKVISLLYSDFIKTTEFGDSESSTIRVIIDKELNIEELDELKEKMESHNFRESRINYKLSKNEVESDTDETVITDGIMDIDTSVINSIQNMAEVENIDKELLIEIYKGVMK